MSEDNEKAPETTKRERPEDEQEDSDGKIFYVGFGIKIFHSATLNLNLFCYFRTPSQSSKGRGKGRGRRVKANRVINFRK